MDWLVLLSATSTPLPQLSKRLSSITPKHPLPPHSLLPIYHTRRTEPTILVSLTPPSTLVLLPTLQSAHLEASGSSPLLDTRLDLQPIHLPASPVLPILEPLSSSWVMLLSPSTTPLFPGPHMIPLRVATLSLALLSFPRCPS